MVIGIEVRKKGRRVDERWYGVWCRGSKFFFCGGLWDLGGYLKEMVDDFFC